MTLSFVYRWRNDSTREWYVGYHTGSADDGYICSSRTARPRITTESGWHRRILRWGTKAAMIELERRILTRLDARRNPKSLNLHNGNGHIGTGRPRRRITKFSADQMFAAIKQASGRDYYELLAENYWQCVLAGDQDQILKYHKMFARNWGPLWFERLGLANQVKRLTDFKSKPKIS